MMTAKSKSKQQVGKKIGEFLTALEAGEYDAEGTPVILGRLPGFPMNTKDPGVVDEACDAILDTLADGTPIMQLKKLQRVKDLRREAERLRGGGDEYLKELREFFVANAAEYFAERGFEYGTLREWEGGLLSAKLLKEAGIK